jgi:hypothetical protein
MGTPPITPAPPSAHPNWWSRNWKWFVPVGCLTLLAILVAFVGGIIFVVAGSMKSSDAYKLSLAKAQSNPLVQQKLGTPIVAGMFVSGSINVAGTSGKADLTIPISGPKGKGSIYVDATKFAGEWKFNRLEVGIDGETDRIDLLQPLIKDQ